MPIPMKGFGQPGAGKKLLQALIDQNPIAETKNPAIMSSMAKKPGTANITPVTTPKAVGGKIRILEITPTGDQVVVRFDRPGRKGYEPDSWITFNAKDLSWEKADIGMPFPGIDKRKRSQRYSTTEELLSEEDRYYGFKPPRLQVATEHQVLFDEARNAASGFLNNPTIKKYQELPQKIYIRFGNLPKGGKSKNYQTGELLDGVSVIDGHVRFVNGKPAIIPEDITDSGTILSYVMSGKMQPSLYTGEKIGVGPDGEPIISKPKKIGDLKIDDIGNFVLKSLPNPSRPPEGGGQLLNALENPSTLKTIVPILGTAGILYPQTSEAFGKGASLTETISKMGMAAPAGAILPSWRNPERAQAEALQEPLVDPTTLLAGPARWGGGVVNLAFDSLLKLLMGQ